MSDEVAALLREVRETLRGLGEFGLDHLPRSRPAPRPPPATAPAAGAPAQAPALFETSALAEPPADRAAALEALRTEIGPCTRCELSEKRQHVVFGEGNPEARVVFVGEGPGADEDRTGRPFVGRAGELLTKMIEALEWQREDVFICNVVKCRPPGNRDPKPEEIATCHPFLQRQLEIIRPRVIVTLGKPATSTLLGRPVAITRLRGTWQEWNGIPLMPTFHPAYLLRQYTTQNRQAVWDDLRAVRERAGQAD